MEAPRDILRRKKRVRQRKLTSFAVITTIAVLLALIIPLAVILPNRRRSQGLSSVVLLPLYSHAEPAAWQPLFKV